MGMSQTVSSVRRFVESRIDSAERVAEAIQLSANAAQEKYAKVRASWAGDVPRFRDLPVGFAAKRWATVLFCDLRGSSKRADRLPAKASYITMHAYLPTMALLVKDSKGLVVGFRGDGLFGVFGINPFGENPSDLDEEELVRDAVRCGKAMQEAVDEAVSPALEARNIEGGLNIGVGIDANEVVITRIGLDDQVSEVTAYGSAVNKAAKLSDGNHVISLSGGAKEIYPSGKGGNTRFEPRSRGESGFNIVLSSDYRALKP